jgi:Sec-independent protein translocase protein TatA
MDVIVGPELVILIIVFIVVVFWRGPSTLPRLGEALGKAVKGVRDNMPADSKDESEDQGGPAGTAGSGDTTGTGPQTGA